MVAPSDPSPAAPPAPLRSAIDRFLNIVERGGNALPHPATLFAILALLVVLLSWVTAEMGLSVQHPGTGEVVSPVDLLSIEGMHRGS